MRKVRTILTICASNRHDVRRTKHAERLIEFVRPYGALGEGSEPRGQRRLMND